LWSIKDVAYWFAEQLGEAGLLNEIAAEVATLNAAVNARLDLQRIAKQLDERDRRALVDLLPWIKWVDGGRVLQAIGHRLLGPMPA
jgi:hypothetical protein